MSDLSVQSNAITFDGIQQAVSLGLRTDKPVIILGTYGIGKSAGIHLAAAASGYCVVDYRAGEILPEDIGGIGVPRNQDYTDGTAEMLVERAVPDIISAVRAKVAETGKPCIIFLDEITSALPAVQAALFQVLLDRMAGGKAFPKGTYVVAAGNLLTDRSLVEELARPLLNRASVYLYTGPTFQEYDAHMAATEFHPVVRTFLKVNEAYICNKIDPESEQSPTPRSLEGASDILKDRQVPESFRLTALAATVGGACAHEMTAFVNLHMKLVPVDTILADPENVRLPDFSDFAATYMQITSLAASVNARFREQQTDAAKVDMVAGVLAYMLRYPVEMGCVFLGSIRSEVLTLLLVHHTSTIQTAHGGAYLELFPEIVGDK